MQDPLTTGYTPQLSVIVPTINESATLPGLLERLQRQKQIRLEVIVSDGGSKDGTLEVADKAGADSGAIQRRAGPSDE